MNKQAHMPNVTERDPLWSAVAAVDEKETTDASAEQARLDAEQRLAEAAERNRARDEERAAREAEDAMRKAVAKQRTEEGRRRADAIYAGLRAMADDGRDWSSITSDDGNCIWLIETTLSRMAGAAKDKRAADSPRAAGAANSDRVLDRSAETAVAADR